MLGFTRLTWAFVAALGGLLACGGRAESSSFEHDEVSGGSGPGSMGGAPSTDLPRWVAGGSDASGSADSLVGSGGMIAVISITRVERLDTCGNRSLESGEDCDDGNRIAGDGCDDKCLYEPNRFADCGNGRMDPTEVCDDGNTLSGDGCNAHCCVESYWDCRPIPVTSCDCGNGMLERGEGCDDGNTLSGDGCGRYCSIESPTCGNAIVDALEQCDDGNSDPSDACDNSCLRNLCVQKIICGNGRVEPGELCDDGNSLDGDACSSDCRSVPGQSTVSVCGDGVVDAALGETCDDGINDGSYGTCAPGCIWGPHCGDGILQYPEQCENYDGHYCSSSCNLWLP